MKKTAFILPLMILTSALASCSSYKYKYKVEYNETLNHYKDYKSKTFEENQGFQFTYNYSNGHPMKYFWYYEEINKRYFTLTTDDDKSLNFKIEAVSDSKVNSLEYDINNPYLILKSEANENVVIKFRTNINFGGIAAHASDSMPS